MPRSRPTSNPVSYHKHTGQYYVTLSGRRIYLGTDKDQAIRRYHAMGLSSDMRFPERRQPTDLTVKELANRFLAAQRANWQNPEATLKAYKDWLGRFLSDYPRLRATDLTVEAFASWKMSPKDRGYSTESINHYLGAVRAIFRFASDTELLDKPPRLERVQDESRKGRARKPLYNAEDIGALLDKADEQLKAMILLALNCGFGPKDIHDLTWDHIDSDRVTLQRSKTGISQTCMLWPETRELLAEIRLHRQQHTAEGRKPAPDTPPDKHVFLTMFGKTWSKDSLAEQFRKLCGKAGVPCHGFYRLRHCASTAISLVASPHVQRKFMRHSQIQQQVAYTHMPDAEVDVAVMKTRKELLGKM